ncbi:MAG: hypothetical protein RL653_285 [Pseudomonadota bacterium]|jgi:HlyD family secretion protein
MTWWKALLALLCVGGAVAITAAGLRERPPPAEQVSVAEAKRADIRRVVAGSGKLVASTTVKISSNLSGDLTELRVKQGDRVVRGQVLGRLDRRRFEANVRQASAAVSAARADARAAEVEVQRTTAELQRVEGLQEKGISSSAESDRARAARDSAEARFNASRQRAAQAGAVLDEALTQLEKTTLTSPMEGTVIELSREVGERVRGSDFNEDVVMTVAALAAMEVKLEVSEHEVIHLRQGQKADVTLDALEGQLFQGEIVEIAQKATIRNAGSEAEVVSFPVVVALPERPAGALPGMNAEVRITAEVHENAVTVPVQAVTVRPAKDLPAEAGPVEGGALAVKRAGEALARVVFVVGEDGKAHVRRVRTGIASDTDLEILEGLQPGEKVVDGPFRTLARELKDGVRVEEGDGGGKRPRGRG